MKTSALMLALWSLMPITDLHAADPTDVAIDSELETAIRFNEGMLQALKKTNDLSTLAIMSHHKAQVKTLRMVLKEGGRRDKTHFCHR